MLDFLEFLRLSIISHQIQQKLPEHLRNHSLRHSIFFENALCRIKPGQLFEQNPWTPTTLKKWQGVTGHLLTWAAIFVVLFHGLLTNNLVPFDMVNKIESKLCDLKFFWRSRRLLLEYQFENATYWKDKQDFLISEQHGKFKGWTQDFWLIFLRTPKFWVIWGSRKEQANFSKNRYAWPKTKGSGEPGSKNQDPAHICLFLPKLCPQTNQPFWLHDISASGITIETSRLPGLGGKTPWLSYQQTGDEYTKENWHKYLRYSRRLKPFLRCLGLNVVPKIPWSQVLQMPTRHLQQKCFLPTSPRQNLFAQVRLVSANHFHGIHTPADTWSCWSRKTSLDQQKGRYVPLFFKKNSSTELEDLMFFGAMSNHILHTIRSTPTQFNLSSSASLEPNDRKRKNRCGLFPTKKTTILTGVFQWVLSLKDASLNHHLSGKHQSQTRTAETLSASHLPGSKEKENDILPSGVAFFFFVSWGGKSWVPKITGKMSLFSKMKLPNFIRVGEFHKSISKEVEHQTWKTFSIETVWILFATSDSLTLFLGSCRWRVLLSLKSPWLRKCTVNAKISYRFTIIEDHGSRQAVHMLCVQTLNFRSFFSIKIGPPILHQTNHLNLRTHFPGPWEVTSVKSVCLAGNVSTNGQGIVGCTNTNVPPLKKIPKYRPFVF